MPSLESENWWRSVRAGKSLDRLVRMLILPSSPGVKVPEDLIRALVELGGLSCNWSYCDSNKEEATEKGAVHSQFFLTTKKEEVVSRGTSP